jgi:uncharacterized membrane protein
MAIALVYLTCLVVFLGMDAIWLGAASGALYTSVLGDLMLAQFRITPAVLFYLLQIAGILVFVLPRARQSAIPWAAFWFGALFGICTYGTYDLTNQAVLRVWTWPLTVIDMAWGACVTGIASLAGAFVERKLKRA